MDIFMPMKSNAGTVAHSYDSPSILDSYGRNAAAQYPEKAFRADKTLPFDKLPPELRNKIYGYIVPQGEWLNAQFIAIPGLCQLTPLTHREAFPLFIAANKWIWNCYSRLHLSPEHQAVRGWSYEQKYGWRHANTRAYGVQRRWFPAMDCRLYLKMPDHLTRYLASMTVVGAEGVHGNLFALTIEIVQSSSTNPGNATLKVSQHPEDVLPWKDTKRPYEKRRLIYLDPTEIDDHRGRAFLRDLESTLSKGLPNDECADGIEMAGLSMFQLYTIWEKMHNFTRGLWFGLQSRGGPMEMGGLFDSTPGVKRKFQGAETSLEKLDKNERRRFTRRFSAALREPAQILEQYIKCFRHLEWMKKHPGSKGS